MLMFRVDRKKVEAAKSCAEGKIHLFEDSAQDSARLAPALGSFWIHNPVVNYTRHAALSLPLPLFHPHFPSHFIFKAIHTAMASLPNLSP